MFGIQIRYFGRMFLTYLNNYIDYRIFSTHNDVRFSLVYSARMGDDVFDEVTLSSIIDAELEEVVVDATELLTVT